MRTNVYVDAFNLYYGCVKGTRYKWLDLAKLLSLALPQNQINRIRYFTAIVKPRPHDPQQPARQAAYIRALSTLPNLTVHHGRYLESQVWMKLVTPLADGTDKVRVMKSEEKGSDVNIASYLLLDAFDGDYEAAVVVSNDSDLAEPIRLVRKKFNKKVVALMPCNNGRRMSVELKKVASKAIGIDPAHIAASQFPDQLSNARGTIHKPSGW